MGKHIIPLIVLLLLVSSSFVGVSFDIEQSPIPTFGGKTLYVGGSGEGNYTRIQDAIDNASDGDTVFVFNGIYYETLIVDKSINLIGENRTTTIIIGDENNTIITVIADDVLIYHFTFKNGPSGCRIKSNNTKVINNNFFGKIYSGISCWDKSTIYHLNIVNNYINNSDVGISLDNCQNSIVSNNSINSIYWRSIDITFCEELIIENNTLFECEYDGIYLESTRDISIKNNLMENHYWGISVYGDNLKIDISNNVFRNNHIGIGFYFSLFNQASNNHFEDNDIGIIFSLISLFNRVTNNNFINNKNSADFAVGSLYNRWDGNYWDEPRDKPYTIIGTIGFFIPWINFDYHPAKQPYDIGGMV